MICNEGVPVNFYLNKAEHFFNSEEERTLQNFKKFIGVDDKNYNELLKNEQFNDLVQILK